jgi:crotonobetainyl-CoA:carnitine CoA-transferase CaiB-like acyl-CoA transferase
MFDGALSWLAMVAARVFAAGERPRRGAELLGGSVVCYRPYACADGWVTLGALEPKFWAAFCAGVGRPDLTERQFERPGSATHAEVEAIFAARTRAEWASFAAEHDCCLEPVLELDEALESELVRAREMVIAFEQPGAGRCEGSASRSSCRDARRRAAPGTGARRAHARGAARGGLRRRRDHGAARAGRGGRAARPGAAGSFLG